MNRAALFFDIDGTVLSEITKEIPASTVDALKRAHDAGHFLFINTGRTYCSVPVELKKLPFDGYLCGCGIYFTFDEEIIFEKLLGRIHPGAIVLLHSTSSTNAEILDELLTKWEEMGYHFASLDDLIKATAS